MIAGAGNPPKRIAEYLGRLNTESVALSIARTVSPGAGKSRGKLPSLMSMLWSCGAQSALKLFAVPEDDQIVPQRAFPVGDKPLTF